MKRSSKPMKRTRFERKPSIPLRRSPIVRRQNGSSVTKDGRIILEGRDKDALRLAVYMRDQGMCGICHHYVEWSDYEMDHWRDRDGKPLLSRGMGGAKRHDSLETCRTTHRWCNRDRVRKERPVNEPVQAQG